VAFYAHTLSGREAARWYARRIMPRSVAAEASSGTDQVEEPGSLGDLTQEGQKRSRRFLKIRPAAKGSGLSDVSINHDKYLAEDG